MTTHTKYFFGNPLVQERVDTPIDESLGIESYGPYNLYPQYQEQLRLNSPLIKSATEILADFLNGEGWEDNGDLVMNMDFETANDLLDQVAADQSKIGFALWLGFNGAGQIEEVKHVPHAFCRFNIPDKMGHHTEIGVSNNWNNDQYQKTLTKEDITFYPVFNPLTAGEETIKGGKGQILYVTKEKNKYNLSTFDAINNTAETDKLIQEFEKNQSKSGFNGTVIFKYPGDFESDEEEANMVRKVQSLQGSDSPGTLLARIDEEFGGNLIETVPPLNADGLFPLTRQAIIDRVLQTYRIPGSLYGVSPTGGVFSQQAFKESFVTYSLITRNGRKKIARIFNIIGGLMATPVEFGEILENEFAVNGEEVEQAPNQFTEEVEEAPEEEPAPEETEAKLKTIYNAAS